LQAIIDTMAEYMRRHWQPGNYQRAGNTKTHGVVRATVTIRDDLLEHIRRGVFAEPRSYCAYVRYSSPGPDWPRDIGDVGFVSMAIKLMGMPGPKLLDDEKNPQDFLSICTPTFVTPNVVANSQLQQWILNGRPLRSLKVRCSVGSDSAARWAWCRCRGTLSLRSSRSWRSGQGSIRSISPATVCAQASSPVLSR
jgi:hypothetical protein